MKSVLHTQNTIYVKHNKLFNRVAHKIEYVSKFHMGNVYRDNRGYIFPT